MTRHVMQIKGLLLQAVCCMCLYKVIVSYKTENRLLAMGTQTVF